MNKATAKKLVKLKQTLKKMNRVILAYSGGVDSTFLLKVAKDTLGDKVTAVTAVSQTYPKKELVQAKKIADGLCIKHLIIKTNEMKNRKFIKNSPKRCYFCKSELFSKIKKIADSENIKYIIDGSNIDDEKDYRPGSKAILEYNVRSPLKEAKFTKKEIRSALREMKINIWNKPAQACLASRIPYGTKITKKRLKQIEEAEKFLSNLGLDQLRVRYHNEIARIEVPKENFSKILKQSKKITKKFKEIGFNYVTIDLEGYRTGSLNEVLKI